MTITCAQTDATRPLVTLTLCGLLVVGGAAPARAQFKLQQNFENTTAAGWTLSDAAALTAPSIDAAGSGWLRLTAAVKDVKGLALNDAFSFSGNESVAIEFNYVSWGGTGADGITLFLYDPTVASPMSGAAVGGGLGYCGGAGGYLAIGLDEYGNFSNPGDRCGAASGGPGFRPGALVIRGPKAANNAWVTTTLVPGGIDHPTVATRPSPNTVLLTLTPAVPPAIGYTVTAQLQEGSAQPFETLFSNVAFPYTPPATLSVGISGGTGGTTNVHELHGLVTATPDDLQLTMTGPSSVLQGGSVTYDVTLTNNGNYPVGLADSPDVLDTLPASVTGAAWTCTGSGGATCAASGTGSLSSSDVTLPVNGSVTYTLSGTLAPTAPCGSTVVNMATADFAAASHFLDPNETNNSSTVESAVTCNATLVANPASIVFGPQTVGVASTAQTVRLTEGINTAAIGSIAVTGDYTQTNDCPTTLTPSQTCTINLVFTPTREGSRSGTLTIQSNAPASPSVTTHVSLSGTGTNAVPGPFSFTPLDNVDLSSTQVSNAVTVANTNVPSPISVSSGAQYSINGGPFTAIGGLVSPGAQVRVQVSAASNFSTAVSAVLSIGGVDSTFTVTTGTQPVLQGGFTPLTGAAPSSVQVSNSVTITGTTIPAAITIGSGALYSINGAPFTSAPGIVQPGAQVRIEVTTPPAYNTTASAVVTIGGIESAFTVTTAAQPTLQGGFAPVSNAAPSSVQASNPITVTGTTIAVPISVSSGASYSINGGPFSAAAGIVQPGDQVRVELTAASAYSTAAAATVTVGGISSTFTVTTATPPTLQGRFAPVVNAAPSSMQVSNALTVTGTAIPVPIGISSGAQYSINGGPFSAAAGIVKPGDQVTVEVDAAAAYGTAASAILNVGGVAATFTVTTAPQPALQGSFLPISDAVPSSVQVSNGITVTGTTIPVPITISGGARYSINGGAFTSLPGVISPGSQVIVQLTAPPTYATTASALLSVGGVGSKFLVTTGAQLQNAVVTAGGGGGLDTAAVVFLALLAGLRLLGRGRAWFVMAPVITTLVALGSGVARAGDDGGWPTNVYGGLRVGGSSSSMTSAKLTAGLRADGYDVSATDTQRSDLSSTLYVGYGFPKNFGVELAWTYLGRTRAELEGLVPPDLNRLLADAAHIVRGSGNLVALEARYRLTVAPHIAVDLRGGPYLWITQTDVWVGGVDALSRTDDGLGYTVGLGPRYAVGQHLGLGLGADWFASTSANRFVQITATADYRF